MVGSKRELNNIGQSREECDRRQQNKTYHRVEWNLVDKMRQNITEDYYRLESNRVDKIGQRFK